MCENVREEAGRTLQISESKGNSLPRTMTSGGRVHTAIFSIVERKWTLYISKSTSKPEATCLVWLFIGH